MIPLKQTIFDFEYGNCFSTCIASILEVPIESVPNFCAKDTDTFDDQNRREDWYRRSTKWLHDRGVYTVGFDWADDLPKGFIFHPYEQFWAVIGGVSPRWTGEGDKFHAMVGRVRTEYVQTDSGWGHQMYVDGIHDPHPDNTGVKEIRDVLVLIPGPRYPVTV